MSQGLLAFVLLTEFVLLSIRILWGPSLEAGGVMIVYNVKI